MSIQKEKKKKKRIELEEGKEERHYQINIKSQESFQML
jgi:hypothetical protein